MYMKASIPWRSMVSVVFLVAVLAVPARGTAWAASRSGSPAVALNTRDFDTTLLGTTKDRKHKIQLEVAREPGDKLVEVTISVLSSGNSSATGSSYAFTIPASDLTVTSRGAKLDTHSHLGAYGHITAQWKYISSPSIIRTDSSCNPAPSASYTQVMAVASATLDLTFPCDGVVKTTLHAESVAVNTGSVPLATNTMPGSTQSFYQSLYFSGNLALKSAGNKQLVVGSYTFDTGTSVLVVGVDSPGSGTIGLTRADHFATDSLAPSALTTHGGSSSLQYSGALGTANLTFTRKGQQFSLERPAKCVDPNASTQDQAKLLTISTAQASVAGKANVTACVTVKATFGASDMGTDLATSAGTAGGTGGGLTLPTPPAIVGIGTPLPTPPTIGGAMHITNVIPADGSTGVSTTPQISATLSAAPSPGQVNFLVTGADNPTLIGVVPPPTYDAASKTETSTPITALQPNTRYRLMVVAGSSTGVATSITTFTTGS
jgi:Bacterial Ig-like domain